MDELLRMEHVSKRFGDFYANRDINLSVRKGEVHTLLGENGAGKSTLMNVLIGLYQPTEGKIFLNGKEVRIDSPAQAVKLGIGRSGLAAWFRPCLSWPGRAGVRYIGASIPHRYASCLSLPLEAWPAFAS